MWGLGFFARLVRASGVIQLMLRFLSDQKLLLCSLKPSSASCHSSPRLHDTLEAYIRSLHSIPRTPNPAYVKLQPKRQLSSWLPARLRRWLCLPPVLSSETQWIRIETGIYIPGGMGPPSPHGTAFIPFGKESLYKSGGLALRSLATQEQELWVYGTHLKSRSSNLVPCTLGRWAGEAGDQDFVGIYIYICSLGEYEGYIGVTLG